LKGRVQLKNSLIRHLTDRVSDKRAALHSTIKVGSVLKQQLERLDLFVS
jgi:hypothetical protein